MNFEHENHRYRKSIKDIPKGLSCCCFCSNPFLQIKDWKERCVVLVNGKSKTV